MERRSGGKELFGQISAVKLSATVAQCAAEVSFRVVTGSSKRKMTERGCAGMR